MSSNNNQNFMDPKTILAVSLVGVIFLGWQYYMQKKYPNMYDVKSSTPVISSSEIKNSNKSGTVASEANNPTPTSPIVKNGEIGEIKQEEQLIKFEDEIWSFDISSQGMGLRNITLKKFKDREGQLMKIGLDSEKLSFETNYIGRKAPIFFNIKQIGVREFVGTSQVGKTIIEKRYIVHSETNSIETKIYVSGVSGDDNFTGLSTYLVDKISATGKSSFLSHFEKQEIFVSHDGEKDRIVISDEDVTESFNKVNIVSLGSQYFTLAMLDQSDILPEVKANLLQDTKTMVTSLSHNILSRSKDFHVNYVAFAGPKSMDLLNKVDASFSEIIDFGFFSSLATYILKLMKWFYGIFGNWGVAIILLTILVRLVVLPFNLMSFKSMKKMQDIQPHIKALREKYKEEPQKLNQEMMLLMKDNRVNPLGGCLPMLLQFPVFIALYQVLGQSVELYQAPFAFWIYDLSLKDPFYVLPVLMGITMFLQQKLTPSTMDPAQQKIFMFMPVIFSLFMISLPSGLTLYIFVSALFAVIQQYILMRDRKKTA